MRLKNKTLTGVVQPLSYVDKMLRQQGFHRSGGDSMPTYDVVMYDSASSSAYFLRIPTNYTSTTTGKGELNVKLGHPYLEAKFYMNTSSEEIFFIPKAVREAAEHKLAEIADYLSAPSAPS
ncbi:hypothetical protein [Brevibacillus fortis]|uniref:YugN-like family protein n=1 Tax=Brevibacillus fortis TaxID=2126352 RepID=A0A2P7V2V0_9BACL|nr:hypothetical protein [Brevibacillus fortis]PSJ93513.1 hypothetical protein C7R93_18535 [Brevibacillus fortis]